MGLKSKIFTTASLVVLSFVFAHLFINPTHAACNFYASMTTTNKNVNWTSICTVSGVDGIDNAQLTESSTINTSVLTLGANGAITINSAGKLLTGSLIFSGGNVAIQSGGVIKAGYPIYANDSDADGWSPNFILFDATGSGKRRLGLLRSYGSLDCNDSNDFRIDNICCVVGTYYPDSDGDGYGAGAPVSMCPTAGYVANNTDCYNSNANAKPGSTYCGTANRGDGSFDFNCSATSTKCGTIYNYSPNLTTWVGSHGTGSCNRNNVACRSNNINHYPGAAAGCGQLGALCTVQTWHEEGCGDCGESPDSQYRCTAVSTAYQGCQ